MEFMILAGFLGSGKTTLLLQIARTLIDRSLKVVIIENEIGEIGIDGSYLSSEGLQVQELFGGCICCTLTVGLVETISEIEALYNPDIILIESTGMARPDDLIKTIRQYKNHYKKGINDIKTITVVDAERYEALRNTLAPLFEAQIEAADIVLLNKIDSVDKSRVDEIACDLKTIGNTSKVFSLSMVDNREVGHVLKEIL